MPNVYLISNVQGLPWNVVDAERVPHQQCTGVTLECGRCRTYTSSAMYRGYPGMWSMPNVYLISNVQGLPWNVVDAERIPHQQCTGVTLECGQCRTYTSSAMYRGYPGMWSMPNVYLISNVQGLPWNVVDAERVPHQQCTGVTLECGRCRTYTSSAMYRGYPGMWSMPNVYLISNVQGLPWNVVDAERVPHQAHPETLNTYRKFVQKLRGGTSG